MYQPAIKNLFILNSDYSEERQQKHWKNINFQHLTLADYKRDVSIQRTLLQFSAKPKEPWRLKWPTVCKYNMWIFLLCSERGKGSHLIQFETFFKCRRTFFIAYISFFFWVNHPTQAIFGKDEKKKFLSHSSVAFSVGNYKCDSLDFPKHQRGRASNNHSRNKRGGAFKNRN